MTRSLSLGLLLVLAAGCGADDESDRVDVAPVGTEALAEVAVLLDADRPWNAARLVRRYQAGGGDLDAATRLLAARAEAHIGDWPRVNDLLDRVDGLDTLDDGRGRYLLGRARDEAGDLASARAHYDAFLGLADAREIRAERDAARLRRALVIARLDRGAAADAFAEVPNVSEDWLAVLEAEALARDGNVERVDALAERFTQGALGRRAWAARIEAARQASDLGAARRLADEARRRAGTDAGRAAFTLTAGRLAADAGEPGAARGLFRAAIDADPASRAAREAAALLREGELEAADWLALARTDRALGLNSEAADAFRQWLGADAATLDEQADVRYQAADALFDAQRYDDVEAMLAPIRERSDARELWAGTLSRMGRADEAAALYLDLAESASDPAPSLYFAADALQQGGDADGAIALYRQIEREHAGTRWAGLATMRRAGQAFLNEEYVEAARLWDGYRTRQPRGTHALRSQYWAGRALAEAGDAAAEEQFTAVLREDRDSYYGLLAADALGQPFWPIPFVASPPVDSAAAARVADDLRGVDVLREAGFPDAASSELDRVIPGVRGQAARYALAEALIDRGYGRRAILLGQGLGGGMNERRMRILYPFPYRRMIAAEAEERGFDPFIAAALIRQESQFEERATSYVGARGLMQLMPATGRTLASEVGIEAWDPDLLYLPEVNVHLGTRYVGQQVEAYDGALPAVFGAYNAGPHQVDAWRAFPEFGRDALFTERIPFRETRDYVKILTRNRAIYEGLYGAD